MVSGTIFSEHGTQFRVIIQKDGKGYKSFLDMYGFVSQASGVKKEGWTNVASTWWDKPHVMLHKKVLLDNLFYSDHSF